MNVKELKEALSKLPDDLPVVVKDNEWGDLDTVRSVIATIAEDSRGYTDNRLAVRYLFLPGDRPNYVPPPFSKITVALISI